MATEDDEGWIDNDAIFGDTDPGDVENVELSRADADVVTDALADFELDESHENAGTAENVASATPTDSATKAFGDASARRERVRHLLATCSG